jgi:hypothetical protein
MMGILQDVGCALYTAVHNTVEKNRRAAQRNRLKTVLKNENDLITRSYIALGKHCYHDLRSEAGEQAEAICRSIDVAMARMDKARQRLAALCEEERPCGMGPDETAAPACCKCEADDFAGGNPPPAPKPAAGEAADDAVDPVPPLAADPEIGGERE